MNNEYNTKEDIIEARPGIWGFSINLNALWRRFRKESNPDKVLIVARRFEQLFNDHGIATTQIPRFIPQVTLDKLNSPELLLTALTDEVIDNTAKLFQVRRSWIEGQSNVMYDCLSCYKNPVGFFKDISTLDLDFQTVVYPIVAFCQAENISCRYKYHRQPLVIVLIEKIADLGDNEIKRYRIYGDEWDWSYWRSRMQLRAMFRVLHLHKGTVIPLIKVSPQVLEDISWGRIVPSPSLGKQLHNLSLEDFVLTPVESAVSKESEDLGEVVEYIESCDLDNAAYSILGKKTV